MSGSPQRAHPVPSGNGIFGAYKSQTNHVSGGRVQGRGQSGVRKEGEGRMGEEGPDKAGVGKERPTLESVDPASPNPLVRGVKLPPRS